MNDPALDPEEGGGLVVRFKHDRSLRTLDEAAIIDMLSVLVTLLSDNDTAAALIAVGCPPAEAQGLVKQIKHLMRFALCVACVQNGVTDERSALALALRLNKKKSSQHTTAIRTPMLRCASCATSSSAPTTRSTSPGNCDCAPAWSNAPPGLSGVRLPRKCQPGVGAFAWRPGGVPTEPKLGGSGRTLPPGRFVPSYCLWCSIEWPPKPPIPRRSTTQARAGGDAE